MLKKDRYRGNTFFKNPEYLDAIEVKKLLDNLSLLGYYKAVKA